MGISSGIGSGLGLGFGLGFWGIAEAVSKKLNNSITKIQINGKYGTGFFMKIEIGGKTTNYLITLNQIISQDQINSKINIDLFYGEFDEEHKTIKLDESIRKIRTFENGAILIEIIPNDGISKEKFLLPDLNYKQGYEIYKNANVYTLGFNDNYEKKEIFPDKITLVNDSKFSHKLNANLCSLICSIENQFVIGIHKQDYNGIFIGEILDTLQKENDNKINKIKFYYFDENKENFFLFHKNVLNKFYNQNDNNFDLALNDLNNYFSDKKEHKLKNIIDILKNFKNIENYDETLKNSLGTQGFLDKINTVIRMDDNELSEKFYYFIATFLDILVKSGCIIRNQIQLYRGAVMDYNRLLEYKNNIGKLIFYKGFCPATKVRAAAAIFGRAIGNTKDYSVIEVIQYKFQSGWRPYCFDISKYDTFREMETALFTLYTCFKIKDVKIDENNKTAEIFLDSVGIKTGESIKDIKNIVYNDSESVFEVA